MIFAFAMPLIMIFFGAAVDTSRLFNQKLAAQVALDTMLLDSVAEKGTEDIRSRLQQRLAAEKKAFNLVSLDITETGSFVRVSATVSTSVDPMFPDVLDLEDNTVHVNATVEARRKISSVRFRPVRAKGGYPKKVELFVVRDEDETQVELLATMLYKVDEGGTVCTIVGNIQLDTCGTLDLGRYKRAYLKFSVWEQGGQIERDGRAPDVVIDSHDPANSYRFVIDGEQQANGVSVDVFGLMGCDKQSVHEWEDMVNFFEHDTRDFVYEVRGYCSEDLVHEKMVQIIN